MIRTKSKLAHYFFFIILHTGYLTLQAGSFQAQLDEEIIRLTQEYKRKFMVLEIGAQQTPYIFELAKNRNAVCVALLVEGGQQNSVHSVVSNGYHNIMILAPHKIAHKELETLGKCEHFDIVIVHDCLDYLNFNALRTVDALLSLGDHCFIAHTAHDLLPHLYKKSKCIKTDHFVAIYTPKSYLDLARFTQKVQGKSKIKKYKIKSSFTQKIFTKTTKKQPTLWIEGLNLVTFAMLKGIYPADARIRQEIKRIEKFYPEHNDLVLGNIIVQGDSLVPIDMADQRRNADLKHCVTAALGSFKAGNKRLVNPEKWIKNYYNCFN